MTFIFALLLVASLQCACAQAADQGPEDCKLSLLGKEYVGDLDVTSSGRTCQPWNSQSPHQHTRNNPEMFPDETLEDAANFCRNPDDDPEGPWCYTTDPDKRWEHCDIRVCQGPKDCRSSVLGKEYTGDLSVTKYGRQCQPWTSQSPHHHTRNDPEKFPDVTLEDAANFCRNPDDAPNGPWCYTTDPDHRWEYCDVLFCPE